MMKKTLYTLLTAVLIFGFCGPSIASAVSINQEEKNTVSEPKDPLNTFENSPFFNVEKNGEDTIVTATVEDFNNYLVSIGLEEYVIQPSFESNLMARAGRDGVFKIVWHGQARNGNVDLYLPASWMNNAKNLGFNFVVGALGALVGGWIGAGVLNAIASQITVTQHRYGRVFVVRGFYYQYFYYQ